MNCCKALTNCSTGRFVLVTQRFLINRWETPIGKQVFKEIIDGIKRGADVRSVLDPYVLDHVESSDPYGHPHYPKSEMGEESFWVLTQDDLRGIHVYNEVFSDKAWFGSKSLNYARFYNCTLSGARFERTSLTRTMFEKCNLKNAGLEIAGGYNTRFTDCNMKQACFYDASLIETDFSGADLTGAYFEKAYFNKIIVNYNTIFGPNIERTHQARELPREQEPEIFKAFRIAYANAELWNTADKFLYKERSSNRKYILWPKIKSDKKKSAYVIWLKEYLWDFAAGYGVRPYKIWIAGFLVALVFAGIYYFAGNPCNEAGFPTSLYFSFTTFATLGYGDLSYSASRWFMRLISTAEAWLGAVLISTFVAVMARKILRY
ncbi:MAG: hypothetical protein ACI8PB_004973 [Desulforhopalus sp.]